MRGRQLEQAVEIDARFDLSVADEDIAAVVGLMHLMREHRGKGAELEIVLAQNTIDLLLLGGQGGTVLTGETVRATDPVHVDRFTAKGCGNCVGDDALDPGNAIHVLMMQRGQDAIAGSHGGN